jgi:hypothetical protein
VTLGLAGWQQISTPRWPIAWASLSFDDGTNTKTFAEAIDANWINPWAFWYDPATEEYQLADMGSALDPWKAYWIQTYVDNLEMILPLDEPYIPAGPGTSALSIKAVPEGLTPPPPPNAPMVSAQMLEFGNYPNPIKDVHTTTFEVKGALASLVEAIKVGIFDQAGRLVYESGQIAGASVDWHTDNDYGEYLANGVYLYKMYALVSGRWIVSDVRKLAILR